MIYQEHMFQERNRSIIHQQDESPVDVNLITQGEYAWQNIY